LGGEGQIRWRQLPPTVAALIHVRVPQHPRCPFPSSVGSGGRGKARSAGRSGVLVKPGFAAGASWRLVSAAARVMSSKRPTTRSSLFAQVEALERQRCDYPSSPNCGELRDLWSDPYLGGMSKRGK